MSKEKEMIEQAVALTETEEDDSSKSKIFIMPPIGGLLGGSGRPAPRIVRLFGEVNDEQSERIIDELMTLADTAEELVPKDPQDPECKDMERVIHEIDFLISTYGGNADDMFAIYDFMKKFRDFVPIHTAGVGKVMSAGVLLLAAGTKGERRIGKNTRVMIHHVAGGIAGSLPSMEADLDSIKAMEDRYIDVMISETKFTKRTLRKLLDRRVNIYLSAEEAIEYGIADKLI
tara:strand:- start:455 stop:1147 length:693 start_codon:yes stop_codon:yes gene_type:complete